MNDHFLRYSTDVDTLAHTLRFVASNTINSPADTTRTKPNFVYERVAKDSLILDGDLGGHKMHFGLILRPFDAFLQKSRGFHSIQQSPYNR